MIKYVLLFCLLSFPVHAMPCFINMGQDHCLKYYIQDQNLNDIRKSLEKGANPNSAFELALNTKNPAVVKLLLNHGADTERQTSVGGVAVSKTVVSGSRVKTDKALTYSASPDFRG